MATHHGNLAKRFVEGLFAPVGVGSFDYDSSIHELKHIDLTTMRSIILGVDFGWTPPSALLSWALTMTTAPKSWMSSIRIVLKQKRLFWNIKKCLQRMVRAK